MIKQLLLTCAVAAVAFNVNADKKVLWEAPTAEGVLVKGWSEPVLTLDATEAAQIKAGDNIIMTVASADKTLSEWPQVAIKVGTEPSWPPTMSDLVYEPKVVTYGITYDIANQIHENGIIFYGDAVYISKVELEAGTVEIGPNTVWFGPQEGSWGSLIGAGKETYADLKVGDTIVVEYDTSYTGTNVNLLFGGWGGCPINIGRFNDVDFITNDAEKGTITVELTAAAEKFDNWANDPAKDEPKDWNLLAQIKENSFYVQGPSIINQILYIQAAAESDVKYYAVGGFQNWNVETPAEFTFADGVYTLVAEKASTMKISTAAGNWDDFNAATIAPAGDANADGSIPFEVKENYEFVLDYEATWTATIDPAKQTISFTTKDEKPETVIYVIGSMTDEWKVQEEWKLTTTDGNLYTLANVNISKDDEFKIADANWGSVNYGADEAVAPNTAVTLVYNGGNIKLTESVENATVEFNLSEKTLKVSTGGSVGAISVDGQQAVYYNLQGVKVANPVEGNIYIVKKGTKVSKIAF